MFSVVIDKWMKQTLNFDFLKFLINICKMDMLKSISYVDIIKVRTRINYKEIQNKPSPLEFIISWKWTGHMNCLKLISICLYGFMMNKNGRLC